MRYTLQRASIGLILRRAGCGPRPLRCSLVKYRRVFASLAPRGRGSSLGLARSIRVKPAVLCVIALGLASCAPPNSWDAPALEQANFVNGGFESGTIAPGWTVTPAQWGDGTGTIGFVNFPPRTFTDLNLTQNVGQNLSGIVTAGVPPQLTAADSLRMPFSGADAAQVNGPIFSAGSWQGLHNANIMTQSMTTTVSDVDASDGKIHLRFAVAPVLNNPAHNPNQQPYFFVELTNTTRSLSLFNTFNFASQAGVQWKTAAVSLNADPEQYTDWQVIDIAPSPAAIAVGDTISATVVGSGCSLNGHFGEAFVDDFGTTFPSPAALVQAPAFTLANSNLTYTVTAKNSSAGTITNAIVDFTTPVLTDSNPGAAAKTANTTWVSTSSPGVTCVNPTAGTAGTVVCNVGTLAGGASYTFTVTVKVPNVPGGSVGTDYVNEGTYDIHSDQSPVTNGSLVQTQVTALKLVDLQTTLTDGTTSVLWNTADSYTLTVHNNSANAVTGVTIADTRPAQLNSPTWTCVATGAGSSCVTASGSGNINTTANIGANGTLTYTIVTKTANLSGNASFTYSAVATLPAAFAQSVPFDNYGSDTDTVSTSMGTLTVTKAGTGTGKVTSEPGPISCGATCSASYASGTQEALTAQPTAGSAFTGWSGGGCTGNTNPCTVTVVSPGPTTVAAEFDVPVLTTSLATTSNGGSQNVRPGDTANFDVHILIPAGATVPVKVSDVFPVGLALDSITTPVVTGALTCGIGGCVAPTQVAGATSTWDFGSVTCSTAAACAIDFDVVGRVAANTTRGTTLVDAISATFMPSQNLPTLTVIEPNLTVSRTDSPSMGLARGSATTVTVTLANNTGGANSDAFDVVVSFPIPANFTGGNYQIGSCPGATATFTGGNAVFTLPTGATGRIVAGTSCTFTYDLTAGPAATGNATINIAAGTATSKSVTGTAPPAKSYTTAGPAITVGTAPLPNSQGCLAAVECLSDICDTDHKCGLPDGEGPCAGNNSLCRSGLCSVTGMCGPTGGCLADGDCDTATQFCNTQTEMCTPKLPNASPVPTITGHMPPLTGMCSAPVATVVCVSAVCDSDNKCGYAQGDGPCTPGDSPVCRSGFCGGDSLCGPMGGCLADSDCDTTTQFCNTETQLCTPKLPNASPVPTIMGHMPALTGMCSAPVAVVVCISAVCDSADNECGFANGDGSCDASSAMTVCRSGACGSDGKCGLPNGEGPCTNADAATVCRQGVCSVSGVCGAPGGCEVDADCDTSTQFCDTSAHKCTPKLPNGDPVPTISGHTPPLTGTCSAPVATVVCVSAVCDTADNECGFANGDGSCDASNATVVCRSGACGSDGACGEIDGQPCSVTTVCRSGLCNSGGTCGAPSSTTGGKTFAVAGGGVTCSMGAQHSGESGSGWLAALLLGCVALLKRRRQRRESDTRG